MKAIKTYGYGHDFGNAETCGVTSVGGMKLSKCVVSAIAPGNMDTLNRLEVKLGPSHFVFRGKGQAGEHFVGDLALEQSSMAFNGRGDISRYWSEKSKIMLLTVAASLIPDTEFALNVVTGLPVQTYIGDPECRKLIKEALNGTHVFSVNGYERVVHIEVYKVIMEGAGAAIAYAGGDEEMLGVVDIGGRTTDLYVARGQKRLQHKCNGKALGVEIAGDRLSANFQRQYGRPLTSLEVRETLRAHANHDPLPCIVARGHEVQINSLVEEALRQVGDEIASFISSQWGESESGNEVASSLSKVLSIGGGARYFFNQLQALIPHATFVERPEEANAYGYAMMAAQTLKFPRAV